MNLIFKSNKSRFINFFLKSRVPLHHQDLRFAGGGKTLSVLIAIFVWAECHVQIKNIFKPRNDMDFVYILRFLCVTWSLSILGDIYFLDIF